MWTGSTAFCEFFLNPTIGTLSDTYGRKPFMVLAPYAAIVLKAWVSPNPDTTRDPNLIVHFLVRTFAGLGSPFNHITHYRENYV